MVEGTGESWTLAPCFHGVESELDPSSLPSSLPHLFLRLTREAEGGAGWRALFLHNRTKVIWHHACKVIAIYTKLQFQVEMRSICQIQLKSI
jgi:hypothetical protein